MKHFVDEFLSHGVIIEDIQSFISLILNEPSIVYRTFGEKGKCAQFFLDFHFERLSGADYESCSNAYKKECVKALESGIPYEGICDKDYLFIREYRLLNKLGLFDDNFENYDWQKLQAFRLCYKNGFDLRINNLINMYDGKSLLELAFFVQKGFSIYEGLGFSLSTIKSLKKLFNQGLRLQPIHKEVFKDIRYLLDTHNAYRIPCLIKTLQKFFSELLNKTFFISDLKKVVKAMKYLDEFYLTDVIELICCTKDIDFALCYYDIIFSIFPDEIEESICWIEKQINLYGADFVKKTIIYLSKKSLKTRCFIANCFSDHLHELNDEDRWTYVKNFIDFYADIYTAELDYSKIRLEQLEFFIDNHLDERFLNKKSLDILENTMFLIKYINDSRFDDIFQIMNNLDIVEVSQQTIQYIFEENPTIETEDLIDLLKTYHPYPKYFLEMKHLGYRLSMAYSLENADPSKNDNSYKDLSNCPKEMWNLKSIK